MLSFRRPDLVAPRLREDGARSSRGGPWCRRRDGGPRGCPPFELQHFVIGRSERGAMTAKEACRTRSCLPCGVARRFVTSARCSQATPTPAWATPALIALGLASSFAETLGISLVVLFLYSAMGHAADVAFIGGVLGSIFRPVASARKRQVDGRCDPRPDSRARRAGAGLSSRSAHRSPIASAKARGTAFTINISRSATTSYGSASRPS